MAWPACARQRAMSCHAMSLGCTQVHNTPVQPSSACDLIELHALGAADDEPPGADGAPRAFVTRGDVAVHAAIVLVLGFNRSHVRPVPSGS